MDDRDGTRGDEHRFGGDWTAQKLRVVSEYLSAYTTALKNRSFTTGYIDAFAGTGYRTTADPEANAVGGVQQLLFPDLAADEPQRVLEGSAKLALQTRPRFDRYIFIESRQERCHDLERLRTEFPELAEDVLVKQGDANRVLPDLCRANWSKHRAVLFLDPYGMQVEWATIEAIALTRAVDLWILFPLGIGVNRLLPQSGQIPASWRRRLDLLLGTPDWFDAFYEKRVTRTLFEDNHVELVKHGIETIGRFFLKRLGTVFPAVAPRPGVLRNTRHCPLYLLCFAVASENPKAQEIAMNIAEHLLKGMETWPDPPSNGPSRPGTR